MPVRYWDAQMRRRNMLLGALAALVAIAGAVTSLTWAARGAYSHEYFPRLSNDGHWLIWGAAAEGHEHDRADYEIFVWEIGTTWETAIRLTYHPGNDQWPDLHVKR